MNWRTHSTTIRFRGLARLLGITRILGYFLGRTGYEKAFDDALFAAIHPCDVVWDVGANVGHYTQKFAAAVGEGGRVFAFEPFPSTLARLHAGLSAVVNGSLGEIVTIPAALGAEVGKVIMKGGMDNLAATSRILEVGESTFASSGSCEISEVEVETGDSLVSQERAALPNIIKIDTEGFELEVLQGMTQLLLAPSLRGVFVEVHFGLLAERGMANAPSKIETLLRETGFDTSWVDPSHIVATRQKLA